MTKADKRKECIEELKKLQGSGDREIAHGEADKLIVKYLYDLNEWEIAKEFEKIDKWYA